MLRVLDGIKLKIQKWDPLTKKVVLSAVVIGTVSVVAKLVLIMKKKDHYSNVPHFKATKVVECNNYFGECCVWDDIKQILYWIDSKNCKLWAYDPKNKKNWSYNLPEKPGSFGLCKNNPDLLIMCFYDGPRYYNLKTRKVSERFFDFERNMKTNMNDGRCDRQGRFVVGGIFHIILSDNYSKIGKLLRDVYQLLVANTNIYRINKDLTCEKLVNNIRCANSICFSKDGTIMYYADTFAFINGGIKQIRNYNTSKPSKSELFCNKFNGNADGSCIDSNGNMWNANCTNGTICCIDRNGDILMVVDVPETFVSCCCFGGELLDTLYITTINGAMFGYTTPPSVGNLYAVKIPNVTGVKESRFDGKII